MKRTNLHVALVAAAAVGSLSVVAYSSLGQAPQQHEKEQDGVKCGMHDMKQEASGDADYDFAKMMRHHHEMGMKMAEHELKSGKDVEMRAMAQKVVDGQKKEIAQLDAWLAKHEQGASKQQGAAHDH